MPIPCPTLVIRHPAGKEYWAEQEIGDTIFPYDNNVEIKTTSHRGVMLVYTSLDPLQAYRLARRETYTSINNVIPAVNCAPLQEAYETIRHALYQCPDTVRLDVHIRGEAKEVLDEEKLKELITGSGYRVNRRSPAVLHIETIYDKIIVFCEEHS